MKLLQLSLATIMAMGTILVADDSLSDAFKNGTLNGELKAYYYNRVAYNGVYDNAHKLDGDIINFGIKLDYETAAFYNFKVGLGIQTSNAPWVDTDGKEAYGTTPGRGLQDMWGSGAVLSQAYLSYTANKTIIKVGRQYIDMPLIGSAPSRLTVESFQGATIISNEIPNTTLMAAYVNRFQGWTDGEGNIADFQKLGNNVDYAYALAIVNKSLANTTLTASYGQLDNTFDMMYADAKYDGKAAAFTYNAAIQYGNVNYDNSSINDAYFYGVKVGLGIANFNTYIAYAQIKDGDAWWGTAGSGTIPLIYTSSVVLSGQYAESKQYAIDANYLIKEIGLLVGARYMNIDYTVSEDKADITTVYAGISFDKALKGLGATIAYEDESHDTNKVADRKELWFRGSYKF
ncbi:MAG: OprD family outer membrane porin [Sulfurospirillaceae bacterium]|nr:OprD family outer membrane porin [Sulfurospirillaceae bacterium]MDD2826501.1 OprD family outer membrane porin [Sulfurospirillaceae bacterium]